MTLAEIVRWEKGAIYRRKEKAQFDYILADLIGISAGRFICKDVEYPAFEDAYSGLFNEQKQEQDNEEEIAQKNINRFLQFAQAHNAAMTKGGEDVNGS